MRPRRVRFEARVFRGESVAFAPCPGFRVGRDPDVCHCGWPADDHRHVPAADALPARLRLPVALPAFARR